MSVKPSELERLRHIIEAIDRILRFREDLTYEDFSKNEMAQFAIIKCFEIIGEAAYHLPREMRETYNHIEWRKIIAFRHILVHDYYKVNTTIIWNAIENKLIELKVDIERITTGDK